MPKLPPIQPFEARIVKVPISEKIKTPEGVKTQTVGMATVGIRVQLPEGEYFFYSTKHGSWTRHLPGLPLRYKTGEPTGEVGPERITKFKSLDDLRKRLGHARIEYNGQKVSLTHLIVLLRNSVQ